MYVERFKVTNVLFYKQMPYIAIYLYTWHVDVERVKYLGMLYTGLDTISLFMVPKIS